MDILEEFIQRYEKETSNEFYTVNVDRGEDLYSYDFVCWLIKQLQDNGNEVNVLMKSLVKDLAQWSERYPRGRTYSIRQITMDDELIEMEERAKELSKHIS